MLTSVYEFTVRKLLGSFGCWLRLLADALAGTWSIVASFSGVLIAKIAHRAIVRISAVVGIAAAVVGISSLSWATAVLVLVIPATSSETKIIKQALGHERGNNFCLQLTFHVGWSRSSRTSRYLSCAPDANQYVESFPSSVQQPHKRYCQRTTCSCRRRHCSRHSPLRGQHQSRFLSRPSSRPRRRSPKTDQGNRYCLFVASPIRLLSWGHPPENFEGQQT